MDTALPFLAFVAGHAYLAVFVANTIDATGIPFPGRIVLILAGAFVATKLQLACSIVGRRGGPALLAAYCLLTLGSERCVEDAVKYFRRVGPSAILLGRYSTGIRLFAAILSGCGYIRYFALPHVRCCGFPRVCDVVGHRRPRVR
jgi:membrane protein DedA with SNARE-associated domain